MSYGQAIGELRAVLQDDDAIRHFDDALNSWSRVVLGLVDPDDRVKPVRVDLTVRQRWALDRARRCGRVSARDMKDKWSWYDPETLRLDLARLVELGDLLAIGRTRSRFYVPANGNGHQVNTSGNTSGNSAGCPDALVHVVSGVTPTRRHSQALTNDVRGGAE